MLISCLTRCLAPHLGKAARPTVMLFCASPVANNSSVFLFWKTPKQSFIVHINLSTSMLNLCLLLTWQLDYTYYTICHQHIHYLAINGPSTVIFDFIYSCNCCELGLYTFQLAVCQHSPNSSEAVKTG